MDNADTELTQTEQRRDFVTKIAAVIASGVVALFPLFAGLVTFFHPLIRKNQLPKSRRQHNSGGPEGFVHICSLDALEQDGPPQRFPVIADQQDAWNFDPDQPVGAIFIQRTGPMALRIFSTTCPHLGCSVSCNGQLYECPCHNSSFNLDGTKRVSRSGRPNPSPRDMDSLNVDQERLAAGEVWVEFVNFYPGKENKIRKL